MLSPYMQLKLGFLAATRSRRLICLRRARHQSAWLKVRPCLTQCEVTVVGLHDALSRINPKQPAMRMFTTTIQSEEVSHKAGQLELNRTSKVFGDVETAAFSAPSVRHILGCWPRLRPLPSPTKSLKATSPTSLWPPSQLQKGWMHVKCFYSLCAHPKL